jgi:hypothetical protein
MEHVMYVLIRDDLPNHYASVQAGHAVAEYLRHNKTTWANGTLIYLSVADIFDLMRWREKLKWKNIPSNMFFEPDIGEFTTMATVVTDRKIFRGLKLKV